MVGIRFKKKKEKRERERERERETHTIIWKKLSNWLSAVSCSSWSDQTVGGRGSFLDLFVSVVAWSNDRASVYKAVEAVEVVLRRVVFF